MRKMDRKNANTATDTTGKPVLMAGEELTLVLAPKAGRKTRVVVLPPPWHIFATAVAKNCHGGGNFSFGLCGRCFCPRVRTIAKPNIRTKVLEPHGKASLSGAGTIADAPRHSHGTAMPKQKWSRAPAPSYRGKGFRLHDIGR